MNITPLFPTPLGIVSNFISSKERIQLLKNIQSLSHSPHGTIMGNGASTHGYNMNFVNRDIKNRIQTAVNEYVGAYGCYAAPLRNIWSNIQNAGSGLKEHTHPQSTVSGALYINVDETCMLYFHNPNPYVIFSEYEERNPYNSEWFGVRVENRQLVLFPSWLKHGKNDEINQMDDRIVVSFNCGGFR